MVSGFQCQAAPRRLAVSTTAILSSSCSTVLTLIQLDLTPRIESLLPKLEEDRVSEKDSEAREALQAISGRTFMHGFI